MAFLLPATFQKRLFRYALSQLDFLDMATFDLDRLEGAWGSRSTGEIKDVPFKLDKLSELLSLPPWVKITKAKVLRLRLTVPFAIWKEGIEVEIDGVEISCCISNEEQKEKVIQKGVKANQPRSTQPRKHDPGGDDQGIIPTVEAMAQSFVEHEPEQEKEEIRSAIARQQHLDDDQVSTSSEGEELGVAPAYTLPGLAANFLWDVGERLRVSIKNVSFEVQIRLDLPSVSSLQASAELVTFRLTVDSLDVHGVKASGQVQSEPTASLGNHRLVISNIQGFVVSDPSLFSTFSAMSVPPSPTTTHGSTFRRDTSNLSTRSFPRSASPDRMSATSQPASLSESQEIAMSRSTILDAPPNMFRSMYGGDGTAESLDDIPDHEPISQSMLSSRYHAFGSEAEVSQFEDYSSPDQSFLENGRLSNRDSFPGPLADSDTLPAVTLAAESRASDRPKTPTQADPGASSTLSGASSAAPPPSQLLELAMKQEVGAHRSIDMTTSTADASVFHEFPDDSTQAVLQESSLFHDSRSRSNSDAEESASAHSASPSNAINEQDPLPSESATPTQIPADLMQSTLFTSEQAQSMYMSAMDKGHASSVSNIHVPGGWDVEYDPVESSKASDTDGLGLRSVVVGPSAEIGSSFDVSAHEPVERRAETAFSQSSEVSEHEMPQKQEEIPSRAVRKRFFNIKSITVEAPASLFRPRTGDRPDSSPRESQSDQVRRMPGSMSIYEDSHTRLERSTMRASVTAARQASLGSDQGEEIAVPSVHIDEVQLANDMGLTKLAIISVQQVLTSQSMSQSSTEEEPKKSQDASPWRVNIDKVTWAFVDVLKGRLDTDDDHGSTDSLESMQVLLVTQIDSLAISRKSRGDDTLIDASVGKYTFGYSDEPILSFDSSVKMRESVRDILAPSSKDIELSIRLSSKSGPDIRIMTLPLHVVLDLRRLDETFSWFGGLSVMLGLGNSVMSTTTIIDSRSPPKAPRVRFETSVAEPALEEKPLAETKAAKITTRVGGVLFDLHGKSSSLRLEGSALKLVQRSEGLGMRIDKLRFTGPIIPLANDDPAVAINFGPLNLEFLQTPKEQDLARLIGLLSPSSQREDSEEDDILIDTLLRQRRKASLLRLNVEKVKGDVRNIKDLEHFAVLGEEMKKLATVTKYLPEDDRPGIMVLSLIQEVDIGLAVDRRFGTALIRSDNIELALITMPYLLLLGLDSVFATRGEEKLLGEVLPQKKRDRRGRMVESTQQRTPMLLVKFIGNDLEPTFKVRCWNVSVEYHVTTIMAALGIEETASGEVVIAEMVQSVANLSQSQSPPRLSAQSSGLSEISATGIKPLKVDIGLRDCVIALNPLRCPARGLVVLGKTKVSAAVPRSENSAVQAVIELSQSSFMAVDDTSILTMPEQSNVPGRTFAPIYGSGHRLALQRMGYVHTADISSAKVTVKMSGKRGGESRTMDVEVTDKLFILESCADSTQTMAAIFGGLSPPMPPSTDLKYRTEAESLQDMLASFTGDAFVADDDPGSTYEHVEKPAEFDDSLSDSSDLAQHLGYTMPDTGSIPGAASSSRFKSKPSANMRFNFGDDFFVQKEGWDGKAQEWDTSRGRYKRANPERIRKSPLRIKIRDLHLIWNLFDGYDWQHTRDVIGDAVAEVERKAAERQARRAGKTSFDLEEDEDSVIGDFLFNSIYIGVGAKNDPRDLARQVNRNLADDSSETDSYATPTTVISASPSGRALKTRRRRLRLDRSKHHKITFELTGVSADVVVFPPESGETQNSVDIRVHDLEVFDHIHTSTWKKFATYMHDAGPREVDMPMIHVELLTVKPVAEVVASEMVLRLNVLPLRLHVDQDALDFITRFFEFKDSSAPKPDEPPVPSDQPFLQRVEVGAIPVKLDFKPKRVDYAGLRSGRTTEFMNFIVLESSDMVLQRAIIYGVSGFERLGKTLNDIWTPEVKANQLAGVLAGLAPVRGIVNVGSGIRDLVVVPMREYRKDGRLVRAIQKGAVTFAKNTSTELAKLGARVALGTQTILQNAEGILTGVGAEEEVPGNIATTAGHDDEVAQHISPYADQPLGVLAGAKGAWRHLERDLLLARDAIIAIPGEIKEGGSAQGAAKAILRAAPTVILRPAMGVTGATGRMLMGATNALDRQEQRRTADKYKQI